MNETMNDMSCSPRARRPHMKTSTPICHERIDHPAAWTNQRLGGKAGITYHLNQRQLTAFEELLALTRHLGPQEVTRHDFDHAVVNPLFAELRNEIMDGRGAIVIAGIEPGRFSEEDFERIYWGIGTHLGVAAANRASRVRSPFITRFCSSDPTYWSRFIGDSRTPQPKRLAATRPSPRTTCQCFLTWLARGAGRRREPRCRSTVPP